MSRLISRTHPTFFYRTFLSPLKVRAFPIKSHVSHSLNSLNGGYIGDYIGTTIRVIQGDTRSLVKVFSCLFPTLPV